MMNKLILLIIVIYSMNVFSDEEKNTGYGCQWSENEMVQRITDFAIDDKNNSKYKGLRPSYTLPGVEVEFSLAGPDIDPEVGGYYEGFFRTGKVDLLTIPIINLQFSTKKDDILYVCIYLNTEDDANNHVTIYFLEGDHLDSTKTFGKLTFEDSKQPKIKFSPMNVEFRLIENTTEEVADTFSKIPLINNVLRMCSKAVKSITKGVHVFLAEIFETGVNKVHVHRSGITMFWGLELLGHNNKVAQKTFERKIPFVSHDQE